MKLVTSFILTLFFLQTLSLSIANNSSTDFLKINKNDETETSKTPNVFLQSSVSTVFTNLGAHPDSSLLGNFYKSESETIQSRLGQLDRCYLSSLKDTTEKSLFEEPLSALVYKYLQTYYPKTESENLKGSQSKELAEKKIVNLVKNIKLVGKHVIDCLMALDDPNFEPTKLTLNRLSMEVYFLAILTQPAQVFQFLVYRKT